MSANVDRRTFYTRISAIIIVSTLVLTFSLVGILAIVAGDLTATSQRLPWYLVIGAIAFVGTIILLEGHGATGREIIVTATITAIWSFVLVSLAVEGMRYTIQNPSDVFDSQLPLYFLAAALLGTGLAYWGLHHWREFIGRAERL